MSTQTAEAEPPTAAAGSDAAAPRAPDPKRAPSESQGPADPDADRRTDIRERDALVDLGPSLYTGDLQPPGAIAVRHARNAVAVSAGLTDWLQVDGAVYVPFLPRSTGGGGVAVHVGGRWDRWRAKLTGELSATDRAQPTSPSTKLFLWPKLAATWQLCLSTGCGTSLIHSTRVDVDGDPWLVTGLALRATLGYASFFVQPRLSADLLGGNDAERAPSFVYGVRLSHRNASVEAMHVHWFDGTFYLSDGTRITLALRWL